MAVLRTIVEVLFRTSGGPQVAAEARKIESEVRRTQSSGGGGAGGVAGSSGKDASGKSPGDPDHPQNRGRRSGYLGGPGSLSYQRRVQSLIPSAAAQGLGRIAGAAGAGPGFLGGTATQAGGALAQGAVNVHNAPPGGAGAAAMAIPVAILAIGVTAAATLAAAGISQLAQFRRGERDLAASIGVGRTATSAGNIRGLAARLAFTDTEAMKSAASFASTAGSMRGFGGALGAQRAFGISTGSSGQLAQAVGRRGGDTSRIIEQAVAAGTAQGINLPRGRMSEMVDVMTQIAEGRAPGFKAIDTDQMAKFLASMGKTDAAFAGKGGAVAANAVNQFLQTPGIGQAVGLMASGLGKPGTSFFQALETSQQGLFTKGGPVTPQAIMAQFAGMVGAKDFKGATETQQGLMKMLFSNATGMNMGGAGAIFQGMEGMSSKDLSKKMKDLMPTTMEDAAKLAKSSFTEFDRLNRNWEALLLDIGQKLEPAIPIFAHAVDQFAELINKWSGLNPNNSFIRAASGQGPDDTAAMREAEARQLARNKMQSRHFDPNSGDLRGAKLYSPHQFGDLTIAGGIKQ
jgi:hypothetical protein